MWFVKGPAVWICKCWKFKEKKKEVEQLKLRECEAPPVDNITRKQLKQIIQDHGEKIYGLFFNVVGINTSNARRVSNSIKEEPCIVLYCLGKSLIPFGEKRLPESIAGWPCDIREDFVRFGRCPGNCPAQNRSLPDTGCSIGIKSDSSSGSAGFLYKSKEPTNALGDGFFTAAHVAVKAFEDLFPDKSFRTANLCPEQLRLWNIKYFRIETTLTILHICALIWYTQKLKKIV